MCPPWDWEFPEYPSDWEEIRRGAVSRDGGRCQECGTSRHPLHVHHIESLSRGGSDDPSNLVTLCEDCHSQYHSHMGGGRRRAWEPTTRPTFYPQLGVTSAELRAYEDRHGLTGTPYSFESMNAALKSPYGAFPPKPKSVDSMQPIPRKRRRTLLKLSCVALLLLVNGAAWGSLLILLLFWA
jgi:hypothetical protein